MPIALGLLFSLTETLHMVDTLLAALKFLAILVTGIQAVVGLLVDYKKDGRWMSS